jgi:NADPH2:quinone reductase
MMSRAAAGNPGVAGCGLVFFVCMETAKMMSKAVRIDRHGGPEELKIVDVEVGEPGPGEIRIRHKAVGLNFIDTYQRSGLYPFAMPLQLGMEASGVVEAVGEGVTHLKAGDRAAYASPPPGAYCELRVMPAKNVCKLPDDISFETGAAMMLKGLTTQYLLKKTLPAEGLRRATSCCSTRPRAAWASSPASGPRRWACS